MSLNIDDLKLYLPKYLSPESQKEIFNALKDFPPNINQRFYTEYLSGNESIFQGDGIAHMLVANWPQTEHKKIPSIIFSNTCDIDPSNTRYFQSRIVYAPILRLNNYINIIKENSKKEEKIIDDHISAIKDQLITQILYLPKIEGKMEESIVFLDRVCNCPASYIKKEDIISNRIFTLSNLGAYLFVTKISIHFSRLTDGIDRNNLKA